MARRLALGLALLLVVGSCGRAKDDNPEITTGTTQTTAATDGATPPPSNNDGSPTPTTRAAAGASTRPNPSTPSQARNDDKLSAITDAAESAPGQFAGVLLAPGAANAIVLDVKVGAGSSANQDSLDNMAAILRAQSGKSVTVSGPVALGGVGGGTHSAAQVRSLADSQGTPDRAGVAVVHVFYMAGQFEKDGTLGVSVRGDTLAIFTDEIDSSTSPFVTETRLERAVTTHELGHLLGLVDLYLDDNRDDPQHPGHSTNRGSVMYWAVETSLVGQVLGGPPPVEFDSFDLADLRRIRGGAPAA